MNRSIAAVLLVAILIVASGGASGVSNGVVGPQPQVVPNGTNTTNTTNGTATNGSGDNTTDLPNTTNVTDGNATNGTNTTNATNTTNSSGGGWWDNAADSLTDGMEDAAGAAAVAAMNAIFLTLTEQDAELLAGLLRFAMEIIVVRGAPIAAIGGEGVGALFGTPDVAVYSTLYDINQQLVAGLGVTIFGLLVMFRWFGAGIMPGPAPKSLLGIAAETGVELFRLLLSWVVPWAHFLVAAALSLWALPSQERIVNSAGEAEAALTGGALIALFAFVISFVIVLVMIYLIYLHLVKFVHAHVGLAVYPLFVAFSIPQGKWFAAISDRADQLVYDYPEAAWYPFPTAVTLGVGYLIADGVVALFGTTFEGLSLPVLAVYYPILWIGALYAPAWVFRQNVRRDISTAALGSFALGAGAGGAAGASTGASAGAGTGAAAGAGSKALPSGVQSNSVALGLPSGGSKPPKEFMQPSPGADILDSKGAGSETQPNPWNSTAAPPPSTSTSSSGGSTGGATGATRTASASSPSGPIRPQTRDEFDFEQGYEPVREMKSGYSRIDPAKDASWAVDGGFERMNQAYENDVYLRGEDGQLYDPREITSEPAYSDGRNTMNSEDARTVRDTRDA